MTANRPAGAAAPKVIGVSCRQQRSPGAPLLAVNSLVTLGLGQLPGSPLLSCLGSDSKPQEADAAHAGTVCTALGLQHGSSAQPAASPAGRRDPALTRTGPREAAGGSSTPPRPSAPRVLVAQVARPRLSFETTSATSRCTAGKVLAASIADRGWWPSSICGAAASASRGPKCRVEEARAVRGPTRSLGFPGLLAAHATVRFSPNSITPRPGLLGWGYVRSLLCPARGRMGEPRYC